MTHTEKVKDGSGNYIDRFRRQSGCLFEYNYDHNCYLVIYRNDRYKTLRALVDAYREELNNTLIEDY